MSFDPRLRLREPAPAPLAEPRPLATPTPRAAEPAEAPPEEPATPSSELLGLLAAATHAHEPPNPVPSATSADTPSSEERLSVARVAVRLSRLGAIVVSLQKRGADPLQVEIVLSDATAATLARTRAAELVHDLDETAPVRLRIRTSVDLEPASPADPPTLGISA